MKPEEALKIIGDWISEQTEARKYFKGEIYELSEALIVLKRVVEKQVPKKVDISPYNIKFCPVCKGSVWQIKHESKYCFRCGQKIDWR